MIWRTAECGSRSNFTVVWQVAESDSEVELSAQYLTGANARRRSRAPAANLPHAAQAGTLPCTKVANELNHDSHCGSAKPKSVPAAACVSTVPENAKLCHTHILKGVLRERHTLDTAGMRTKDPFQDLAERMFHQNLTLAAAGAAPGGAAAAAEGAGSHHGAYHADHRQAVKGLQNCNTGESLKQVRVLDAQERLAFHERCYLSLTLLCVKADHVHTMFSQFNVQLMNNGKVH